MSTRFIPHVRLDRLLEVISRKPALFAEGAQRLCTALDALGLGLQITDPESWRGGAPAPRVTVEHQLSCEVGRMALMGREEELRLALRIEFARIRLGRADDGSQSPALCRRRQEWHALRLEMVERNLYLVLINVERYRNIRADRADLIQAAAAAMFRAVDGFDWRRGVLFRTYAVYWLNQGFRSYLYDLNRTVRVPVYVQKSIKHVNAAIQRLGDPHASLEEIARESGLRHSTVTKACTAVRRIRSLDAPLDALDGARTLGSDLALKDDEGPYSIALEDISIESGIEAALGRLNERERRVVQMRFGIGGQRAHIHAEVAQALGVSLERVRQILVRAIAKMRTPGLRKMLEPLLT